MVAIVVRARFAYRAVGRDDAWEIKKGDVGILHWKPHRRFTSLLEPCVVWDDDPQRLRRPGILSSLETVGLQSGNVRVLISAR